MDAQPEEIQRAGQDDAGTHACHGEAVGHGHADPCQPHPPKLMQVEVDDARRPSLANEADKGGATVAVCMENGRDRAPV